MELKCGDTLYSQRNSVAEHHRLVTDDVRIEPLLTPIESTHFQQKKGNNADKARLDISARGVYPAPARLR